MLDAGQDATSPHVTIPRLSPAQHSPPHTPPCNLCLWTLAVLALLSFTARRRRRRGNQPYYGTGWMAPPPKYGNHGSDYQMNPQTGAGAGASAGTYPPPPQPPPAYGPQYGHGQPQPQYQYQYYGQPQQGQPQQYSGTMPASDQAYYGQQQQYHETGVQPPANTHQPGK
ncbi:Chitin synthesis regulation, resistance to Congo red [Geosmithia morbida]|uniref:Chitin synthesis regulation, resistance to Congo red n=1 Tax=Geosmithia morbida TaxID=1094350 RepID=A0A9P4YX85_9HYPO|nr:Chitin synthesis regulation, resistance to Congo red [Geosmithia morbida]KAF4123459.1 Chitin synthesis regulation, resistance to Congo red [Geosmithia morbida]